MPTDITLPGVSSLSPPGVYVNLLFAQGQSGSPTQPYDVVLLGNITSQGSLWGNLLADGYLFGPDTLISCQSASDADALCGNGSPLALMFRAFKNLNQTTRVYISPVMPAIGTAATQVITITVGAGQTSGVITWQCDAKNPAQAVFSATDTVSVIATSLANAINSNQSLPVTATANLGVVTVTAKVVGARWNNLLGFAQVVAGSGVSVSVSSPTRFTGGGGSDATNYTNTLNQLALTGRRFYYYVAEAGCDNIDGTTNQITTTIQAQIDSLALPSAGLRQRAIFGSNDTVAHTVAATTSLNDARCEVIQIADLDLMPGELAATWAAAVTLTETTPLNASGVNFDGFGADAGSQPLWHVRAPLNGKAPSASDIQTAIISGITPLKVGPGGTTRVIQRCTTRFYTTVNAQNLIDLRVQDAGVVTICDRFFDDLGNMLALRFPRKMIGQDPVAGSPPAAPGVVTKSKVLSVCQEVVANYAAAGLIDGVSTLKGLVVQINPSDPSSFGIIVPLFNNALAHRFLIQGNQVGPVVI